MSRKHKFLVLIVVYRTGITNIHKSMDFVNIIKHPHFIELVWLSGNVPIMT